MDRSNLESYPSASCCAESRRASVVALLVIGILLRHLASSLGIGRRGGQQPDLAHDCSRIVEIDVAKYFAIAHIDHADASDRKLFPRLEHVFVGATKHPFDGAMPAVNISALQLELEIGNAFQFGKEELANLSLTVTNLAKSHILIEDIVSEQREHLVRVVGI